jgi:hypothetical protein
LLFETASGVSSFNFYKYNEHRRFKALQQTQISNNDALQLYLNANVTASTAPKRGREDDMDGAGLIKRLHHDAVPRRTIKGITAAWEHGASACSRVVLDLDDDTALTYAAWPNDGIIILPDRLDGSHVHRSNSCVMLAYARALSPEQSEDNVRILAARLHEDWTKDARDAMSVLSRSDTPGRSAICQLGHDLLSQDHMINPLLPAYFSSSMLSGKTIVIFRVDMATRSSVLRLDVIWGGPMSMATASNVIFLLADESCQHAQALAPIGHASALMTRIYSGLLNVNVSCRMNQLFARGWRDMLTLEPHAGWLSDAPEGMCRQCATPLF